MLQCAITGLMPKIKHIILRMADYRFGNYTKNLNLAFYSEFDLSTPWWFV
jgi:hypothetical protein